MIRWAFLCALALTVTGSVRASPAEALAYTAVVADVVSTRYALNQGATERNPIYGSDPSYLALGIGAAVRAGAIYAIARYGGPHADATLMVLSCITFSIAGNNVAVGKGDERGPAVMIGFSIPIAGRLIWP
ncbi:hypothetical protein [Panacagrimonas sp.]|uniref:hypothetical protein n=1 Tax=Panacagrimonas sp. TaxID=2480088 RepID=UPI003B51B055